MSNELEQYQFPDDLKKMDKDELSLFELCYTGFFIR